jgi:hypothetical protein
MHGTVKHDKKINVWGYFSATSLHRIEGIMDQDIYMGFREEPMLQSADLMFGRENWFFQQDNDPSTPPNVFVSGLLTIIFQRLSDQLNLLISI